MHGVTARQSEEIFLANRWRLRGGQKKKRTFGTFDLFTVQASRIRMISARIEIVRSIIT
jgi:hypothetical protein